MENNNMDDIVQDNLKHFKSVMHHFVELDSDLKIKNKHFSTAAVNKFIKFNSSPRGIMANSMLSQTIVLNDSKPNRIYSVVDDELGKYTITKKVESGSEVVGIVKRHFNIKTGDVAERVFIVRDIKTGLIDAIEIPSYNKLHPYFGFEYQMDEDIDNYVVGDTIPAETILARPPSLKEDGSYGYGKDLNIALMSLDEDDEDGLVVSEEACKELSFKLYDSFTLDVDEDEFLLNLHGDEDNYKPILDIGETINNGGIVIGKRLSDFRFDPVLLSNKEMTDPNPIFDDLRYCRRDNGIIKDIIVYKNPKRKKHLPTHTTELLDRYHNSSLLFYRQIINIYEQLNRDYYRTFGKDLIVGDNFNRLIVEAYGIVESSADDTRLKKTHKLTPLGLYRIEIVVEFNMVPDTGFKLSDGSANKGIINRVKPRSEMPRDKDGNVADIVMDVKSTPARLNGGRLYEQYFKAAMLRVEYLIKDRLKEHNITDIYTANDAIVKDIFDIPYGFVKLLENRLTKQYDLVYNENDIETMKDVIESIVKDNFRIEMNVGEDKEPYITAMDIRNSIYRPTKDKVTYVTNGKRIVSDKPIMIGPMYIILLSKIADGLLTTSSAAVNHYGLPIVVSKSEKNNMPHKNNPVRALGETEKRIIVNEGGRELAAELSDRNASLITHGIVYESILTSDTPTSIDKAVDRSKHPFGTDRGLTILNTLNKSVGDEIIHIKDNARYVDVTDDETVMLDLGVDEDIE